MKKKKTINPEPQTEEAESEQLVQPETKGRRIANRVINVILVIAIIIAAFATYSSFVSSSGNGVTSLFGIRVMSIQTESMYPTLSPGDLILETGVKDTGALRVGDVITYWTVINGERVLNTHRISEIYDGGGYLIFETKGDNNTVADALTVHESEIVGQWNGAKLKGIGKVFDYLQSSTGFMIVVVIPVAIFFIFHLIQFFRVLFEYQNIKNKLQYEMERGKAEEYVEDEKRRMDETRLKERARLEAELREKLKKEIVASHGGGDGGEPDEAARRAAMEEEIRAQIMAEAEEKRKKEAEKAAMEAEIRERIMAELKAKEEAAAAVEAPAEEAPVEEAPAEEAPAEEAPAEEAPAEEAPAEEVPAEEAPVEEAPVEEAPVEEAPVEEAPVISEADRAAIEAEIRAKMEAEIRARVEAELLAKAQEKK